MLREISSKIDYVAEGIALLTHIGTGEHYADMKESLAKRYAVSFHEGEHKFELLERIEKHAENTFQEEMEEVRYYFSIYGEKESISAEESLTGTLAGMLALLCGECCKSYENTDELRNYLGGLSEKEYCEAFGKELQCYCETIQDESRLIKIDEPFAIISYLMQMDIKDEEKWKLQKIFCDRSEHQEKILALLDKAIAVLKQFQAELEALAEHFCRYWTKNLDGRSITSYLREYAMMELDENTIGFRLSPNMIHCNAIFFRMDTDDSGNSKAPDTFKIGILLDTDFQIWSEHTEESETYANYATQALKLLSDKSKFEILSYIRDKESYGSELAKHLNLTTATVSHHMNALMSAELVTLKRKENRIYYLSNQKKLDEVLRYCQTVLISNH